MKTSLLAAILLLILILAAIFGEVYTVRATDEMVRLMEENASAESLSDLFEQKRRILSIMISHEDLREVEVALSDYEFEKSGENKSRLRDSVEHLKRLLFISYFANNS